MPSSSALHRIEATCKWLTSAVPLPGVAKELHCSVLSMENPEETTLWAAHHAPQSPE